MTQNPAVSTIYDTVKDDFTAVNACILQQLQSDVPLVERIGHYIIEAGGKRLRPLLVLLAGRACGYTGERHVELATIIEFLHTATLLHDDVVDSSDLRRGRSTANAKWGNAPSILVGDFLYSRAFQCMVNIGNMPVMNVLADATNVIAEGEVMQLMNVRDASISEEKYMDVIRCKTAMLFEASSHTAAILSGADETREKALQAYGNHLGMAFQLIDDLLDYNGDSAEMGKNVGDDLTEGKPTLPLIYAMREGSPEDAALIRKAIQKGGLEQLDSILAIVRSSGALEYTEQKAHEQADKAISALACLPDSEHRNAMEELARFAVARSS
ncbi:MAG: octaprenyl diphosphate synthase [Oceanospirillales bacterium LUC14_002_19_P2]|nr:MAG: octaprenyl diphosphate synthase [Oceanospirillales bacterium LUC14_002_19_P2]